MYITGDAGLFELCPNLDCAAGTICMPVGRVGFRCMPICDDTHPCPVLPEAAGIPSDGGLTCSFQSLHYGKAGVCQP
jgi:hypothetical protein